MHNILKLTFRDELPEELWPVGGDRWNAVVLGLLKQPRNLWWDDVTTPAVTESRDDILRLAMTNARKEITSLMARDTDEWDWGRLHTVTLRNQTLGTSGIKPIEALFNRGPYEVGGGPAVVNAMAYDTTQGYTVTSAPTMRMVVDLGNLDQSRWVNQSGVSGHAFHRNYADQTELWARNETWPFVSTRAAVEARTEQRLELVPAGSPWRRWRGRTRPCVWTTSVVGTPRSGYGADMIHKMLDAMAAWIERAKGLDAVADPVADVTDTVLSSKRLTNLHSGTPIGHPVHPLLVTSQRWRDPPPRHVGILVVELHMVGGLDPDQLLRALGGVERGLRIRGQQASSTSRARPAAGRRHQGSRSHRVVGEVGRQRVGGQLPRPVRRLGAGRS